MRIYGGLENFSIQEGGLCQTMAFSKGVQTPEDTMSLAVSAFFKYVMQFDVILYSLIDLF